MSAISFTRSIATLSALFTACFTASFPYFCNNSLASLQGKLGECAAVLVNTATDTEVPAQIRVNAANAALSQCSQWTKNVDMIERLEAMEELMSRVEQEQKSQKRGK